MSRFLNKPEGIPCAWNAQRRENGDGTATMDFSSSWMAYMDRATKEWKHIDLTFTEVADGFELSKAPYGFKAPRFADEEIMFEDNTIFDEGDKQIKEEEPLRKYKRFTFAEHVEGMVTEEGVLYKGAFPSLNADLLLSPHEQHVKNLVVFRTEPPGSDDITIPFSQRHEDSLEVIGGKGDELADFKTEVKQNDMEVADGLLMKRDDFRYIRVRGAYIWDSNGKREKISVTARVSGKEVIMVKNIPRDFFKDAVYPVFTDTTDTFTSNIKDCGITSDHGTFSTYRSGSNLALQTENNVKLFAVNWYASGTTYTGYRSYVWWDTSALTSGAIITAASVDVYYIVTHAAISRTTYLVENRQAATTLATTDWTLIGASGVGTGTNQPYASITRTSGQAAGSMVFTLNATGLTKISKTGNTYFAFISAYDWDNSAPPDESTTGSDFKSADEVANKPTLSVTYSLLPLLNRTYTKLQAVNRASSY